MTTMITSLGLNWLFAYIFPVCTNGVVPLEKAFCY